MTPDDVRLTARLVAAGRIHSVSDEAVTALAQRVLELEAQVAARLDDKDMVRARVMEEREACAQLCAKRGHPHAAAAIRKRGGRPSTKLHVGLRVVTLGVDGGLKGIISSEPVDSTGRWQVDLGSYCEWCHPEELAVLP